DADGAMRLYQDAARVDGSLAEAPFNLAQLHRRRAGVLEGTAAGEELGRASIALTAAQRLDGALLDRPEPPAGPALMNRLLLSPPLPVAELAALPVPEVGAPVQAQLERLLLGGWSATAAWAVPGLLAGLLLLCGLARDRLQASRGCGRCGRSVCRRCVRELPVRSALCGQCVNAFVRRGLVAPRVRALKQSEISRHRAWMGRLALALGALLGGAGHLLSGLPLRGALHVFVFLFLLLGALGAEGLVRVPYGRPESAQQLALLLLVLAPLHLLSLRSLRRRQARAESEAS
ncbi:MAG TPA: hypothetical protein VFO83_06150, partial [Aggregicoccus sp.]|nr:hypothetical protein [Aggregicoccus sp.]